MHDFPFVRFQPFEPARDRPSVTQARIAFETDQAGGLAFDDPGKLPQCVFLVVEVCLKPVHEGVEVAVLMVPTAHVRRRPEPRQMDIADALRGEQRLQGVFGEAFFPADRPFPHIDDERHAGGAEAGDPRFDVFTLIAGRQQTHGGTPHFSDDGVRFQFSGEPSASARRS